LFALLPASPAFAIQTISWTTAPPSTGILGSTASFAWSGTANTFLGARITGCYANFPDGNNYTNSFGGNFTTGNCNFNARTLGQAGTYPITVGFTLSTGGTMSTSWNISVTAPTPVVHTSGDVVTTATSVSGAPAVFSAYGRDAYYGDYAAACSPSAGTIFPMGATVVTCSATSPAGKTGSSQLTVTVEKGTPSMTWVQPPDLLSGQPVGSILNASMVRDDATGTITYFDSSDNVLTPETILPIGDNQAIRAVYTPSGPAAAAYNQTETTRTVNVVLSDFTTGPQATITGDAQVDRVLTAHTGTPDPVADSFSYEWFADGTSIDGETGSTFIPTTDQIGAAITVAVSAVKSGYTAAASTSPATDPVVAGAVTLTGTPSVGVDGATPQVGELLTVDDSAVTASPASATRSYQWLRDGSPIPGADGLEYLLTNDDAGHLISVKVDATKALYDGATPVTSETVGPVDGGEITLPTPTVGGDAVVDDTLTASLPSGLSPADATVAWQWYRDQTPVGDGSSSYSPDADDVGHAITVKATASKDHFDAVTQTSDATEHVAKASFSSSPVAGIEGTAKVGETLTALTGTVVPDPGSYAYEWYSDGALIAGATGSTYVIKAAEQNTRISVQVSASRPGYVTASSLSAETGSVATGLAPDLTFTTDRTDIRRGGSAGLTWSSVDADSVAASGAWGGAKATSGTASVSPTDLGESTYVLKATNDNGTTTSQVTVDVSRAAKTLGVKAPAGLRLAGTSMAVTASGLDAGEAYAIALRGLQVATGTAGPTGVVTRSVTIPASTSEGSAAVTVTGSESDRRGSRTVQVVRNKTLGMRLSRSTAKRGQRQAVTVTGLAAGEQVTVKYRGKRISSTAAKANSKGTYVLGFGVGSLTGKKYVTATGQFAGRNATKTFTVRR
jgi:hypothetical protein